MQRRLYMEKIVYGKGIIKKSDYTGRGAKYMGKILDRKGLYGKKITKRKDYIGRRHI